MAEALVSGSRIGVYEIVDRIGAGGMGAVYRARDTRLGRVVALKVLRSGEDPELLRRLDTEARAASALNHPNIVHIYDVGVSSKEEGAHYVAMEHVEGETLRRRIASGPLPMADVLDLGAQLTDGLAKAHRAGILHRDLKPENLIVTPDGLLKILDFGLAKLLPAPLADVEDRKTLTRQGTQAGVLLGTLEYMSPEQASGKPVDHRTDQFAAGLVIQEMATGRAVFRRDTPAQVLAAVIERDPEPLRRLRPDAPEALDALVARCLQKDPERRFAKTDELASGLAALAGRSRGGGSIASVGLPPPLPPPAAAVPPAFSAEPAARPPLVSAEIVSAPRRPSLYHVQGDGGGRVKTYDEGELAERIRRGRLTGVELARRDDEDEWRPLFESRVFQREVPATGDPRQAARWRALRALGGHFTGFFIVGVVMYSTQGHLPFWMAIWGAVLAAQVLRTSPALWSALRGGSSGAALPPAQAPAALPAGGRPRPALDAAAASPLEQEAVRVRQLIAERHVPDAKRLVAEVDGIVTLVAELARREADLAEQTTPSERASVAASLAEAESKLAAATLAQDRRLYERQLDVLKRRSEAMEKAVRVRDRLRVRRDLAGHQLKQLRLDLSRGAAVELDVPELSSRLQYIRHEVDAQEEVEEIDAATD
ncbi:MAG: serine/threonine-protein kinase [Vicinamibacteria bacterium]